MLFDIEEVKQARIVLASLFLFLVVVLAVLSFVFFKFLTRPPTPAKQQGGSKCTSCPSVIVVDLPSPEISTTPSTGDDTTVTTPRGDNTTPTETSPPVVTDTPDVRDTIPTYETIRETIRERPMGRNPLFCTFGTFQQDLDKVNIDGVCDYVFMPFYVHTNEDTFLNDAHSRTQKMLEKAAGAQNTFYAINVPYRQVHALSADPRKATHTYHDLNFSCHCIGHTTSVVSSLVTRAKRICTEINSLWTNRRHQDVLHDLNTTEGAQKLREYWTTNKVYHYGVLDLEVRPENYDVRSSVQTAFDVLKAFRNMQRDIENDHSTNPGGQRGFVVLGFRVWPLNMMDLLSEIGTALEEFMVDGVIPRTHISEDEFEAHYPECLITGPAPYEVLPNYQVTLVGMRKTMEAVSGMTKWNRIPTLAVSVTMCTRLYMTASLRELYAPCLDHHQPPSTTAEFCKNRFDVYADTKVDKDQITMVSRALGSKILLATFEMYMSISKKICLIMKEFHTLDIALAMFDIECEDWSEECVSVSRGGNDSSVAELRGHARFARSAAYYHALASNVLSATASCP
ncbi:uncharacterized protein LOC144146303 [Haemaphysalis longicornis]